MPDMARVPAWPQAADWPRLSDAWGSLGHDLVLKESPEGQLNHVSPLSLSLDTGLSGVPAEVLKSIESMTLLEAQQRV